MLVKPIIKGKDIPDITVVGGEDIIVPVKFEGYPAPSVSWNLNGEELSASDRITLEDGDDFARLQIKPVLVSDAGTYKLILSNNAGEVETSFDVTVQGNYPIDYILCFYERKTI